MQSTSRDVTASGRAQHLEAVPCLAHPIHQGASISSGILGAVQRGQHFHPITERVTAMESDVPVQCLTVGP